MPLQLQNGQRIPFSKTLRSVYQRGVATCKPPALLPGEPKTDRSMTSSSLTWGTRLPLPLCPHPRLLQVRLHLGLLHLEHNHPSPCFHELAFDWRSHE